MERSQTTSRQDVKLRLVWILLLLKQASDEIIQSGFTVLLIERGPGVSTKPVKTAYSSVAGTAYITFDKVSNPSVPTRMCSYLLEQTQVRVPVSHTLGKVGSGMSVILSNFNHERWMVVCCSISAQRLVVEECLKYVFNILSIRGPLINLPQQMGDTKNGVWETTHIAGSDPCQTRQHDLSGRGLPKLA